MDKVIGWVEYGVGDLMKAAEIIASIPDEEFDLNHWWLPDGMAFDDDRNRMYRVADGQCGCAAGHLANRGAFGLTPEVFEEGADIAYSRLADLFAIRRPVVEFIFSAYAYQYTKGADAKADVIRRLQFCAAEKEAGRL